MKRICISIRDGIFTKYLSGVLKNRSAFIEEMLVKGVEAELEPTESSKGRIVQLIKEVREKESQILVLKQKLLKKEESVESLEAELKKLKDKDNPENWKSVKIGGEGEWS